jgi:hypothetical protein
VSETDSAANKKLASDTGGCKAEDQDQIVIHE